MKRIIINNYILQACENKKFMKTKYKYLSSAKRKKMCLKSQILTSDEIVGVHDS